MEEFRSNSDSARKEELTDKKVEAVVAKAAKLRKKGDARKFADEFFVKDKNDVKSYLLTEVLVPAVKKAISDIVNVGTNMILYGDSGQDKKKSNASRISYRSYYDSDDRVRSGYTHTRYNTPAYDDILYESRGEAEKVLDSMYDILSQYGNVSIADVYDLSKLPNDNYTLERYGWTELPNASVVRVRDGYILRLPFAKPLR